MCLFAPGKQNATEDNCPEGTVFLGDPETGAICLLPAEEQAAARLL